MSEFYIVGSGGFSGEILGLISRSQPEAIFKGFVVTEAPGKLANHISEKEFLAKYVNQPVFLAVGTPSTRERLAFEYKKHGHRLMEFVDPSSVCLSNVSEASFLYPNTAVMPGVSMGVGVLINNNATIGHDSYLGDFVNVLPGANVSGSVSIGSRSTIGSGAFIREGLSIGQDVIIGAGAIVLKDVRDGTVVVGNPAKRYLTE